MASYFRMLCLHINFFGQIYCTQQLVLCSIFKKKTMGKQRQELPSNGGNSHPKCLGMRPMIVAQPIIQRNRPCIDSHTRSHAAHSALDVLQPQLTVNHSVRFAWIDQHLSVSVSLFALFECWWACVRRWNRILLQIGPLCTETKKKTWPEETCAACQENLWQHPSLACSRFEASWRSRVLLLLVQTSDAQG